MPQPPNRPIMIDSPVPAPLAGMITRIAGYAEQGAGMSGSVEIASLTVPLVISFGDPFMIELHREKGAAPAGSFLAGLHPGTVSIQSTGQAGCVQIDFTPLGAWRFFGIALREFGSRLCPLDDLGDRALVNLRTRMASCGDWDGRLRLVERYLLERLGVLRTPEPKSAPAFEMLCRRKGAVSIGRVADEMGWSRKRLVRIFEEEIGGAPKLVARILRFRHAVAQLQRTSNPALVEIALSCGFSDQAHMTREFAAFAGAPPATWIASQR